MDQILKELRARLGINFMTTNAPMLQKEDIAYDINIAMDAQPELVTVSNSGIPAFLSTYVDPKLIKILVSPMKAAEVVGSEIKKGDWLTDTAMFPVIESTGEVVSYGDYNNGGVSGINFNFPQRQSYHYQAMSQWGEKEMERAGLAKIDFANSVGIATILTLNKFQNKTYFFGVDGLQNYGLLNDPNLSAPIAPTMKNAGGTSWTVATALEVVADVSKLYTHLQSQTNGLIDLETPMVLAMSPAAQVGLTKTTEFNVNVMDILKKNYPNLRFVTAPEYATLSGELLQLMVETLDGQRTVDVAFTEKLRAHPIVVDSSSFKQKKSQGTWGAIIYRPFLIAQMLGV